MSESFSSSNPAVDGYLFLQTKLFASNVALLLSSIAVETSGRPLKLYTIYVSGVAQKGLSESQLNSVRRQFASSF